MRSGEFDSKFERQIAELLTSLCFPWAREPTTFKSRKKVPGQKCLVCESPLYRLEGYTPDFKVGDLYLECKGGSLTQSGQARIKRFYKEYGSDVNYVIVFRNNVRLKYLKGNPTVREWGQKYGIPVLVGLDELRGWLNG